VMRRSKYADANAGAELQRVKTDLEQIVRLLRPLARVLSSLISDDDVVDHRYNNYIEDAGENVAELKDDIAAALSVIERLVEETESNAASFTSRRRRLRASGGFSHHAIDASLYAGSTTSGHKRRPSTC